MDAAVRYLSEKLPEVVLDHLVEILVSVALYAVGLLFKKEAIEAAAGKLFRFLLAKLVSAKYLVSLVFHLEDEMELLRKQLPDLKKVILLSADVKPEDEEKRGVFKSFVEDAEDIIDEFDARIARRLLMKVRGYLPSCSDLGLRLFYARIGYKISMVYGGLGRVKSGLDRCRLVDGARECLGVEREGLESCGFSVGDEWVERGSCFVGREAEMEHLRKVLVSKPLTKPSVVLITGMDGIGKTTLVRHVYYYHLCRDIFEFYGWVHVREELDPDVVMGNIFPPITNGRIHSMLEGRRFLIVLDNLRSGRLSRWNELWGLLNKGGDGSKIVITSPDDIRQELRDISVSHTKLGPLSDEECLAIFRYYASPDGVSSSETLEEIGRSAAHKIKGVPFAARVLGSSLRYDIREDIWNDVLTEVTDGNIMSVLRRNYLRLPTQLKQCMAILSMMFHMDYGFSKERTIWTWIACGYVQPSADERLECAGESYFNYLVELSLIEPNLGMSKGKPLYTIHHLVQDLVIDACEAGNLISNDVVATGHQSLLEKRSSRRKLRVLVQSDSICLNMSEHQVQYARILILSSFQSIFGINFGNMIHLRYLCLSAVKIYTLPESVCNIYSLQVLMLNDMVENSPFDTWSLPNLRHLVGGPYIRMAGIGNSGSLQTIHNFNLFTGRDLEELANLKELRGKLKINHLDYVHDRESALKARLSSKEYIEELVLEWKHPTWRSDGPQNSILEDLRPHGNLHTLEINGYMGDRPPRWMGEKHLLKLVKLSLSNLHHLEEMPPLGHLQCLEFLSIDDLRSIRCIDVGFYGSEEVIFPSLIELRLKNMFALEEWKEYSSSQEYCSRWFPSVKLWEVSNCKELTKIPRIPRSLERLLISKAGLKVLPDHSCELCVRILKEVKIRSCPSLKPDYWFQNQRISQLVSLELCNIDKCINLVIKYCSCCLSSLCVGDMAALESITLINVVGPKDNYEGSSAILLESLDVLKRMTIVNCEDGRITARHLKLTSVSCNQISLLKKNGSKFTPDRERTIISGNFV